MKLPEKCVNLINYLRFLPEIGFIIPYNSNINYHSHMNRAETQEELTHYLCRQYGLTETIAANLITEVLAYHNQSHEEFIHQRHRELQESGVTNKNAFQLIQKEICERRFTAPQLTERQIRRILYG